MLPKGKCPFSGNTPPQENTPPPEDEGGGGPPIAPWLQPPSQQHNGDVKPIGKYPEIFNGDRLKAFMDGLRRYFLLNHRVSAFQSYLTKITFTLTLIQGRLVKEWMRNQ